MNPSPESGSSTAPQPSKIQPPIAMTARFSRAILMAAAMLLIGRLIGAV